MSLVDSFTHLNGRPKSDQALPLLQRITSLVKPVMRKHSWRLPVLAEFFPDEPNLLGENMNSGQKILLRLRPPSSPESFYDEEQLVSVMLHELTHNVYGPHDENFYKYLAELEAEYDSFRRNGYEGEGFHSPGSRLGVGVSHNVPPHIARAKAIQAAEKRRAQQNLLGGPGDRRLGGRAPPRGVSHLSPRELAVQAAERRARDEKACGTAKESARREAEKAANESIENKAGVLETVRDGSVYSSTNAPFNRPIVGVEALNADGPSIQTGWSCAVCTLDNPSSASHCLACLLGRPRQNVQSRSVGASSSLPPRIPYDTKPSYGNASTTSSSRMENVEHEPGWSCPVCTLHNLDHFLQCSACLSIRPERILKEGWTCMSCGEGGMPDEFWSCRFCGSIKSSSALA